jgi:HlyD family secretion protein
VANRPAPHLLDDASISEHASATSVRTSSLADRVRSLRLPDDDEMRSRSAGRRVVSTAIVVGGLGLSAVLIYYTLQQGLLGKLRGKAEVAADSAPPTSKAASTKSIETAGKPSPSGSPSSSIPMASSGDVAHEAKGYIIPAHQILVSPMVNGRIMTLSIEEGRRVEKGVVLAELEATEYEADVARAQALLAIAKSRLQELERGNRPEEIAAAQAELAEAEAQRSQLLSDFKRKTQLRETRVLTENEYEQAESQFKAMNQRVERLRNNHTLMVEGPRKEKIEIAKAEVQQSEAELKRSRWRLDNCTIRAPISGTILKKNAEEGNIVNPIAFNGSFSLCEMADLSDLEVDLSIQERDISHVQKGQACKVRTDAYPDRVYDGVVSRLMPIADRAKGAIPVRVKLSVPADEEGVYLKPEMGVIVSFLRTAEKAGPSSAEP